MNKSCDSVKISQLSESTYGTNKRNSVILIEEADKDPPEEIYDRNVRKIRFKEEVTERIYVSTRHQQIRERRINKEGLLDNVSLSHLFPVHQNKMMFG
mgnify:CR=1 FL=1